MQFSHVDDGGKAVMVDISPKPRVRRTATARGVIHLQAATVKMISENLIKKGDVLSVARVAGIMGAKRAADLIPLCHNISIDRVAVDFEVLEEAIEIRGYGICTDKTGIEMEALAAVSIAALTIYDMCKAVDKSMVISDISLLEKTKQDIVT